MSIKDNFEITTENCIAWKHPGGTWFAKCRMCRETRPFGSNEQAYGWMEIHDLDPACKARVEKVKEYLRNGEYAALESMSTVLDPNIAQRIENLEAQNKALQDQLTRLFAILTMPKG